MGPNRARLALLLAGGRPPPLRALAGGRPLPGRRVGESSSLDELRLEGGKREKKLIHNSLFPVFSGTKKLFKCSL